MKTNIKYAIFDLLFYLMSVSLSLVGIIVLLTSDDEASRFSWVTIVFSLFFPVLGHYAFCFHQKYTMV